jgi:hypothetical protein
MHAAVQTSTLYSHADGIVVWHAASEPRWTDGSNTSCAGRPWLPMTYVAVSCVPALELCHLHLPPCVSVGGDLACQQCMNAGPLVLHKAADSQHIIFRVG